jgi:hypothetical protein
MAFNFEKLLDTYFGAVNRQDADGVAALYAHNGILILTDGTTLQGRSAIRDFYVEVCRNTSPAPRVVSAFSSGNRCAAELLVSLPDGSKQPAADIFQDNDDGLIERLRIYICTNPES